MVEDFPVRRGGEASAHTHNSSVILSKRGLSDSADMCSRCILVVLSYFG